MTDPIQIEIARVQAQLDRMEARLEAVESDLAALRDRQVAVAAEGFVAAMDGERKTYADFEWCVQSGDWVPVSLMCGGLEHAVKFPKTYRFRCAHTHALVTAAEIRAAVEAPLVVLGQGTSRTEVRL